MVQKLQEIREDFDNAYTLYDKLMTSDKNIVDLRDSIFGILGKYHWHLQGEAPKWFIPVTPKLIFLGEYVAQLETFVQIVKDEISKKGLSDQEKKIMEKMRQSWLGGKEMISEDISTLMLAIDEEIKYPFFRPLDPDYPHRDKKNTLTINKQSIEQVRKYIDSLVKFGLEYISQN